MGKAFVKKNGVYTDVGDVLVKQGGSYKYGANNVANANIKNGGSYVQFDTDQTAISPMAASVAPSAIYGLRKINPVYSGNCCQVRDSASTLRTVVFDASGNVDQAQFAAWGDGVTFSVATWYDQSGNARNLTATTRPNLILSAYTDAGGNPRPAINFSTKGMTLNGSFTGFTVDSSSSFSAFVIGNTLGHSGSSGAQARPGTYTTQCPVISVGTISGIVFLNSEPKSAEGLSGNVTTSFRGVLESSLDTTAMTGSGTGRYRNIWYNLKKGGYLSGGVDSRIAFENRAYGSLGFADVSGYLSVGCNAARTQTFNGHLSEIIIYNDATNSLTDRECLGIALSQRAYWGSIPASNYLIDSDQCKTANILPLASGGWSLAGDGVFPPIQFYTPGGGVSYETSSTFHKSPPYKVTKMRWSFSNWYTLNTGDEPPERDTGNDIYIRANLFADGVLVSALLFGGNVEYQLASGADIFCDEITGLNWTAKNYEIRTYIRYTGTRPAHYHIPDRGVAARKAANDAEALSLLSGGTISSNMLGGGVYVFGPSFCISDGWDGRPCPLIFGDSIGFGRYDATSWITDGLTSQYGGQDLPFLNMCVQGTRPGNSYNVDAGIFRRKDQLIRYAISINKGRSLWTSIIHEGGVNDAGSGTTASLQSRVLNFLKFVKYRYNPQKLLQTTYTPRNQPPDADWLGSNPDSPALTTGSATADRWQVSDWIKTNPWPLTSYIDVRPIWTGSASGTKWRDLGGVGTLQASVAAGSNTFISSAPATIGNKPALSVGTGNAAIAELLDGVVTASTDNGDGTYTIALSKSTVKSHLSGAAVRYSATGEGVHPGSGLHYTEAGQLVSNAKISGQL